MPQALLLLVGELGVVLRGGLVGCGISDIGDCIMTIFVNFNCPSEIGCALGFRLLNLATNKFDQIESLVCPPDQN